MKTLLAFAIALLLPVLVFAQGNIGNVSQTGGGNSAYINQLGPSNEGYISSSGNDNNDATTAPGHSFICIAEPVEMFAKGISQTGADNYGSITQVATTSTNMAGMMQLGNSNQMLIQQGGANGNVAYADQIGDHNGYATVSWRSILPKSYIWQFGNENSSFVKTIGNNNVTSVLQGYTAAWGGWSGTWVHNTGIADIYQAGDWNVASVEQYGGSVGYDNHAYITQEGSSNDGYVWEGGHSNTGKINTNGNSNKAWQFMGQYPAGNGGYASNSNYAETYQDGNSNESETYVLGHSNSSWVDQDGNDNDSYILQKDANSNNAWATQNGGGNASTQYQYSNSNSSTVTQVGDSNTSTVTQQ